MIPTNGNCGLCQLGQTVGNTLCPKFLNKTNNWPSNNITQIIITDEKDYPYLSGKSTSVTSETTASTNRMIENGLINALRIQWMTVVLLICSLLPYLLLLSNIYSCFNPAISELDLYPLSLIWTFSQYRWRSALLISTTSLFKRLQNHLRNNEPLYIYIIA